jgi:hypothetical protein
MVENDSIFLVQKMGDGQTRLGRLRTGYSADYVRGDTNPVNWVGEFRGIVNAVSRNGDHFDIVLRTKPSDGRLYKFYPDQRPASGGIQGQLTISSPLSLEDIPLRIGPSGIRTKTQKTGRFSISGVPSGYVEITVPSYEYHLAYPANIPVKPEEYSVRSSLPLAQQEELLLLEGGLNYLKGGRTTRSKISLNAFRELVQGGPYYDWTDGLMETIHRDQGDTTGLFELFKSRPVLFDARERLSFLHSTQDPSRKLDVYRSYSGFLENRLDKFLDYRKAILRKQEAGDPMNLSRLRFPLLTGTGTSSSLMPLLRSD